MAFSRLSVAASSAFRRVSRSPGGRPSKQVPDNDNTPVASPRVSAETVDTRSGERSARWSAAQLADIGIGRTSQVSVASSRKAVRLEEPIDSQTSLGRQALLRKNSNDSLSSNLSGEVERYDSDLNLGSTFEVKVVAPGQASGIDIAFSKDDVPSNEEDRYDQELDIRSVVSSEFAGSMVRPSAEKVAVATQTDFVDELIEQKQKISVLEEHKSEIEKMLVEFTKQNKELVAKNNTLEKELSRLRETIGANEITELQNQNSAFKEEMQQLMLANTESSQRVAGEKFEDDAKQMVEVLRHRNEALTRQLTRAENVETQASAVTFERKQLLEEIVALKHEVKTCKNKAHNCNEEEHTMQKSAEDLIEGTKKLKSEYETMQENMLNAAEGEKKARRQSEHSSLKCQQLQLQCLELDEKLAVAVRMEREETLIAQQTQNGFSELQGERARLRERLASAEAECTGFDSFEMLSSRTNLMESECKHFQEECEEMKRERANLKTQVAQAGSSLGAQPQASAKSDMRPAKGSESPGQAKKKGAAALLNGLRSGELTKIVDDMEAKQDNEESIPCKTDVGSPGQAAPAKKEGAIALAAGLRNEEIAKIDDNVDTGQVREKGADAFGSDERAPAQGIPLPVTTSLLNSLTKELRPQSAAHETHLLSSEVTCALQPEGPDVAVLQRDCRELQQMMAAVVHDESELYQLVELLRDHLTQAQEQEKASQLLAEHRLHHCEELENECGELQIELLQGKSVFTPLLQGAGPALTLNWFDLYEVEGDGVKSQSNTQTRKVNFAAKQQATGASVPLDRYDLLQVECEHLKSQLKNQRSEAELAAKKAADEHESLRRDYVKLQRESLGRARSSAAVQLMLEDAASADALYRCDELKRECQQLQGTSLERAKSTAAVQPLLEDAALVDASRYCEDLKRECDMLRGRSNENAMVAVANELLLEDAVAGELDLELSLRSKQNRQRESYAKLENELRVALQANIDIVKEEQTQRVLATRLENELQNAQWQAIRYEKEAARAEEAERFARRSAEAAADLMRRKENLRHCQQLREQVARAAETVKDARQSAETAMDLQRIICDLGSSEIDLTSTSQLSITATPSNQPLSPLA